MIFLDSKNKKHDIALFNLFYIDSEMNCTFLIVDSELKIDSTKYYKADDDGLKEINRKPKEEWIELAYNYFKIHKDRTSYLYGIPKELKGGILNTLIYCSADVDNTIKFDLLAYYENINSKPQTITQNKKHKTKIKK